MSSRVWLVLLGALAACSVRVEGRGPAVEIAEAVAEPSFAPQLAHMTRAKAEAAALALADEAESAPTRWRMAEHDPGELPRWITHESVPRETLEQLALRYGVAARRLRRWNRLSSRGELHPRTPRDLKIRARRFPPPRELLEYRAVAGDDWASVARAHGVRAHRLRSWNRREIGEDIDAGETVRVWIDPLVYAAILDDEPPDPRAAEVPPGGHGIGTPHDGILVAGVQLPPGPGYELKFPETSWGTTWAVRHAVAALDDFHGAGGYAGELVVGVMSKVRGGRLHGHISHQTGRDLDIRLPNQGRRVDWRATLELIRAFARTGAVDRILLDYRAQGRLRRLARREGASEAELDAMFQWPRGSRASGSLVRHSKGHDDHIHVRFTCGPAEPECGDIF